MQLASLNIQTTPAQTGLRSQKGTLQLKQHQADLNIQTNREPLKISTTYPQLSIDQTEAFADANLKNPLRFANDNYGKIKSIVYEYLAKKTQEGTQMMEIEHGYGGAIARIAKQNSQSPEPQLQLVNIPRSMNQTKIDFRPSEISFQVPRHEAAISVNRREPEVHMPKWQTETYVKQKNSISFQAIGAAIDSSL
ncbi:hypothetical protein BpOF4_05645 [Alkalihalophilus pseudofirmus OF4]|uniref:Uncharacterized protein n=1 Tax=Alkalihalophilus pseudofirmus (strain ATCC BAA-2126 / JCM 17055 / OF4) TaxID=398511 RepID=D3FYG8_ALKPO|nr:DUF6470 family protein [Alkalihalophilus pseudofirmus]ADC49191.1 hypothetical protein BpOF4_05645 [Alkalihalophilus pseudofirmus OF4]